MNFAAKFSSLPLSKVHYLSNCQQLLWLSLFLTWLGPSCLRTWLGHAVGLPLPAAALTLTGPTSVKIKYLPWQTETLPFSRENVEILVKKET